MCYKSPSEGQFERNTDTKLCDRHTVKKHKSKNWEKTNEEAGSKAHRRHTTKRKGKQQELKYSREVNKSQVEHMKGITGGGTNGGCEMKKTFTISWR